MYHSITAAAQFESRSFEELRCEDFGIALALPNAKNLSLGGSSAQAVDLLTTNNNNARILSPGIKAAPVLEANESKPAGTVNAATQVKLENGVQVQASGADAPSQPVQAPRRSRALVRLEAVVYLLDRSDKQCGTRKSS